MSAPEPLALGLLAILVMAAANYLMRAAGFWVMAHVPLTARVRRMLEALPGSIVAATVLPIVAKSGPAAILAVAAAAAVMIVLRHEFLAVAAGVLAAALLRSSGI
jgi:uncharacterized membrane protein